MKTDNALKKLNMVHAPKAALSILKGYWGYLFEQYESFLLIIYSF